LAPPGLGKPWLVGKEESLSHGAGSPPSHPVTRSTGTPGAFLVPVEVKPGRSTALALRWLVGYSKARREKTMTERLQNEILDASNGLGAAVKRREDTHKMAESNKAFAHYRW
jgi:small subunit ribosomal protein S7